MKFLKFLLSRFVINSILILLQIIGVIYLFVELSNYFVYVHITILVISYIILLFLISNKENPQLKIPWMIFVLVFPIPGVISYLLYSNQTLSKKVTKKLKRIEQEILPFLDTKELELPKDIQSQTTYIANTSKFKPTMNNDVKYFSSGEMMYESILKDLKQAKEFIFLEFFILYKGSMLEKIVSILKQKVDEGLDVRVIYDDIGSIKHLPSNYDKYLNKLGIKCVKFYPFVPIMSTIHNNRDHRKAIIIDGVIAYTGGINISDEYINKTSPFGYWKDNGIKVMGEGVKNFTGLFLMTWNCFYKKEDTDYSIFFKDTDILSDVVTLQFGDGPSPMYDDFIGENVYLNIINRSTKYLYITTPYLIVDYSITNALKNAAKRGVDVRIVVPHIPDKKPVFWITQSSYLDLIESGVKIYEYTPGFIHSKCILSDGDLAIVGTINFDYRSLVHHFECACLLYKVNCYNDILNDYHNIISESHLVTKKEARKVNRGRKLIVSVIQFFSPLL